MSGYYRKKPVVIEAVQLRWTTWSEVCDFLGEVISESNPARWADTFSDTCGESGPYIELTIPTLEGDHIARHGDWIIKGVQGEFYPCKPDVFAETYEPAASPGEEAAADSCEMCDGTGCPCMRWRDWQSMKEGCECGCPRCGLSSPGEEAAE